MAKRKTIDEALDELMDDYVTTMKKAMWYASKKAKEDIYNQAINCLEDYYDSYKPSQYKRSDSLRHAILPYSEIFKRGKDKLVVKVGVKYDPFELDKYVENNPAYSGSEAYSPVDSWYVIDNFLQGIHPETNGAYEPSKVVYFENIVPPISEDTMDKYLNSYKESFNRSILIEFANLVSK